MPDEILVHETDIEFQGDRYEIRVFCNDEGRHIAKTIFADNDIIINDAPTLNEVLSKHASLLPLAISSRKILRQNGVLSRKHDNRL